MALYCATNKKIQAFLSRNAQLMCLDEQIPDVVFIVGDEQKEISAIKVLFASNSSYFKKIFYGDNVNQKDVIVECDITVTAFEYIRRLFYNLQPKLTDDNIGDILIASHKYSLLSLQEQCIYRISAKNIFKALKVALKLKMNDLVQTIYKALESICIINTEVDKIINSKLFLNAPADVIIGLLKNDSFFISEDKIWLKCKEWCIRRINRVTPSIKSLDDDDDDDDDDEKKEDWSVLMRKFVPFIRYSLMDKSFFAKTVANSSILTLDEKKNISLHLLHSKWKVPYNTTEREPKDESRIGYGFLNNVQSDLLNNRKNMYSSKEYNDITFVVGKEKEEITGIRSLFAANSEFFAKMLYVPTWKKKKIYLPDITITAFKFIQKLFYHLPPKINSNKNCIDILVAANKYLLTALKEICEDYVVQKVGVNNILYNMGYAIKYQLHDLKKKLYTSLQKIVKADRSNSKLLINSEYFMSISKNVIIYLIKSDLLAVCEDMIWSRCKEWCENQVKNNDNKKFVWSDLMKDFAPFIRFTLMENSFFVGQIADSNVLTSQEVTEIALYLLEPTNNKIKFTTKKRLPPKPMPVPPNNNYQNQYNRYERSGYWGANNNQYNSYNSYNRYRRGNW